MIEFRDIHKRFGAKEVLKGVSLKIDAGAVVFIVGTSGVGKSVLVKHLVGLLRPDSGRVLYDNVDITDFREEEFYDVRRSCAMVFQHATLFDGMTVTENVALPLRKLFKKSAKEARQKAGALLDQLDLGRLAESYPPQIGAGLQKRVAIARALAANPRVIIFDEPTTALDPVAALQVDALIRQISTDMGVTCVVVSHDLRSIFSVAHEIVFLYQGRIQLKGPPTRFVDSTDPIVQQFITGAADGPMVL